MPAAVVSVLQAQWAEQLTSEQPCDLVFADRAGQPMSRGAVRNGLARRCRKAGIPVYAPREMRHTFVSVLSDSGMSIEEIADAAGHVNSNVTKTVYRHQIRDEISSAATAWDSLAPRIGSQEQETRP